MSTATAGEQHKLDAEATIKRNPHPDFQSVEDQRPNWRNDLEWRFSKTRDPKWKYGQGGNDQGESLKHEHVEIDPYEEGRPSAFNYKLLISAIVPRPIGFISTTSKDGQSTNLAPFSYTQLVNHDPPVFVVGFAANYENQKDTLKNLIDTGECVINMVSEHFVEAMNSTSINAPYGTSEWALSGLTPASCTTVKCSRVKEAIFATEGKLMDTKEFESRATPGKKTGVLAIIEGTRFWARDDAINSDKNLVDPAVLKPVSRLGGITYGRTTEGMEIPRPEYSQAMEQDYAKELAIPKADGQ